MPGKSLQGVPILLPDNADFAQVVSTTGLPPSCHLPSLALKLSRPTP